MKKKKLKILCVCFMGLNRSRYLASYLKNKGYQTRFGGVGYVRIDTHPQNPFNQEDVNWADIIIVVRKKYKPILEKQYKIKDKKIIVLDVTDLRRIIGEKFPEFKGLDYENFQIKWTKPQLRKAIKFYLPLK